jgi:hypothetical protein
MARQYELGDQSVVVVMVRAPEAVRCPTSSRKRAWT